MMKGNQLTTTGRTMKDTHVITMINEQKYFVLIRTVLFGGLEMSNTRSIQGQFWRFMPY